MNNKISVHSLSYSIDDVTILEDVCMRAKKGQMVGIIGPNGSGKTTLLKHIYRALPPEKKKIFINNRVIESYSYRESSKELTVLRQENQSDFDFKVIDMVLLGRAPYHNYYSDFTKNDKELAVKALRYVGMEEKKEAFYGCLSGGEKQRVLMARSITQQSDIFILDEPTNHLDVHYQWAVMELIKKMNKTVLGVFHELNLASNYCDYIYVLERGHIVRHGTTDSVLTTDMLAKVFKIDADIVENRSGKPYIIYNGAI